MARQPRPIRIEGDVAYVPLTKGYEAVIDAADVHLVQGVCWHVSGTRYAMRNATVDGAKARVYLHRLIAKAPSGFVVDHIDGDGLNNRRSNLRIVTQSENTMNSRKRSDNTSGVKGVYFRKDRNKYQARLVVRGKRVTVGCFATLDAASAAYAAANAKHHGEFGRLG